MKNLLENNKLIAEFMGLDWEEVVGQCKYNLYESGYRDNLIINNPESWVCYNSSWDWLMIVVEKIESIEDGIYQVDILQEGCKILKKCSLLIDKTVSKLEPDTTKIKSVYLACVEFIKWYNKQNKK